MSFDEIFDLTAGVYFNFYNIFNSCIESPLDSVRIAACYVQLVMSASAVPGVLSCGASCCLHMVIPAAAVNAPSRIQSRRQMWYDVS